jgi:hypothetical protein
VSFRFRHRMKSPFYTGRGGCGEGRGRREILRRAFAIRLLRRASAALLPPASRKALTTAGRLDDGQGRVGDEDRFCAEGAEITPDGPLARRRIETRTGSKDCDNSPT